MLEILEEIPKSKKLKGGDVISKITVNSKRFVKACEIAYRAVNPNSIVPAIANILVRVENGKISFTGTNLNQTIITEIDYGDMFASALFLFPAELGMRLLKALPDVPVDISHITFPKTGAAFEDLIAFSVEINYNGNPYRFETFDPMHFVKGQDYSQAKEYTFKSQIITKGLFFCKQSISEDTLKPALTGIYFKAHGNSLVMVSTTGQVLTKYVVDLDDEIEEEVKFTLPGKPSDFINELSGETITLRILSNGVQFSNETTSIFSLLIDERFPDYENAIPTSHTSECIVSINSFKAALNRISILEKDSSKTSLNFTDASIEIDIYDSNFNNEAKDVVEINSLSGPGLKLGINPKFLSKILSKQVGGDMAIRLLEANRAVMIYPEEEPELTLLIMPVML